MRAGVLLALLVLLGACDQSSEGPMRSETALEFPLPDRPVAPLNSDEFKDEAARDERGEAQTVMDLANIADGMTVADIGAGEGYYTVRLAERVGESGRVTAQDIDREALSRIARRVERERLQNISIKPGAVDDPRLPADSFDRIFLVHMYHEVGEPYAFLWRMWPALTQTGQIIVVEVDRPTNAQGIPPALLFCEFESVGYRLIEFIEKPEIKGYFARFERGERRLEPGAIAQCSNS